MAVSTQPGDSASDACKLQLKRLKLSFVVESGTDVRMVEGFARMFELTILGRTIPNGVIISQEPHVALDLVPGPTSRARFAVFVMKELVSRRASTDLVVVQGYGAAAVAANLAARALGKRCIMLICSPVEAYYEERKSRSYAGKPFREREITMLRRIARLNARIGQEYCVLSEYLASVVRSHGTKRRISIVPIYGVDTVQFRPPVENRSELRARIGVDRELPLIFFSSRVAPEKDSETLLESIRILRDEGRAVQVLHRSGGFREFLELARSADVASQVIASDAVRPGPGLALDYQASDLCVQASRAEGLGFSVLESMACGTPVIASDTGGLKETVVDGVTGWSYPVGNPRELANRIAYALDHPEERAAVSSRARALVVERFDSAKAFRSFAELALSGASPTA